MPTVQAYAAGSTLATFDELSHRSTPVNMDAVAAAYPDHPIIEIGDWPASLPWPGGSGATILDPGPGRVKGVIGVRLIPFLTATASLPGQQTKPIPWLWIGAGGVALWLLLRSK